MPVYVIIEIKILNQDLYAEYVERVSPIVKKYQGRYLARGGQITELGGDWHPERIILLEFSSLERVQAWLASSEYAAVAPIREHSATSKAIVIQGCSEPI